MSRQPGPAGRLARAFIDSKLTPLLVAAALGAGLFSVSLTSREEEPQIAVPMVDLFVGLPGASPQEVDNRLAVPLERLMWEIPGVEYVYSSAMPGRVLVTVRFRVGEPNEASLVKVYEALSASSDRMLPGATPPLVRLRTIDDVPVLGLTLYSHAYDDHDLRRIAAELARELARIDEVADVRLIGGRPRRLRVLLDPARLAARRLDPAAVAAALGAHNVTLGAGSYQSGDREVRVEVDSFLTTVEEVRELVVGVHQGRPVRLGGVAEVLDGPAEADQHVSFIPGGEAGAAAPVAPAVTLTLAKRKGADARAVVGAALDRVEALRGPLLPQGVEVAITRDYGATADEKAGELLRHLILAIVSVTVVIALFLGWRGGLVVFVSVPVTFALTLTVYYLFGYTLNRVTLFALIFVTGIVVDDSIIVVENIVRHFATRRPASPREAAIAAVDEVGNPTILATLTVIAAVLPMAFVRGLMGPYMRPMPVGASLAMSFSLLVALVAAPWFAYRLVGLARRRGRASEGEGHDVTRTRSYRLYRRLLVPMLRRPALAYAFLGGVVLLLLLALALFPLKLVTVKMLPFDNKSELQVLIDMPEGTTLERTAVVAREMAEYLRTAPEVTDVQLYAGVAAPINFNGLVRHYDLRRGPHVADLQVNLVHKQHRTEQSHAIARRLRPPIQAIAARAGAAVKVVEVPPGPPVLSTLVTEIYGPDHDSRLELAGQVLEIYRTTDGVVDVDWWVADPWPKEVLRVDREKAALYGVAPAQIARTLRLALEGEQAGLLHDPAEAEPVSIELRLARPQRSGADRLLELRVAGAGATPVPLAELVTVHRTVEATDRHRKNLHPVVYVVGEVAGTTESPVYAILDMAERIDALRTASGAPVAQHYRDEPASTEQVSVKWDGEWQITYEVFRDLGIAFAAVLVLIYLLIVGWFGSLKVPLVMMIAIPLSLIGVLPGHWLFGAFFTATSMIGFIALAGIMVRNSVLLIDFVGLALAEGKTLGEAVVEAGAVRTRPILLTAGTVVVGALVILWDPIFQGLAISLMSGAVASTVLTLLVVPLVHFLTQRRGAERALPEAWAVREGR